MFPLLTILLKMNGWLCPTQCPSVFCRVCFACSSIQGLFLFFPSVGLFLFLSPSFPLLAFPFIIIANVRVLVIWCLLHHVPLVSFTTCHRWVCPVTVDWKCVSVATVEQNNHRKTYTHNRRSQTSEGRLWMILTETVLICPVLFSDLLY